VGETQWLLNHPSHQRATPPPPPLSLSRARATLVTPTTSTPVQDNISLILPLVFHLASTHLDRDTQRRIHWSVEGPRGSETPTVLDDKLYLVDFSKENVDLDACLIAKTNMGWLWHRRLAHVGMKNLYKLLKAAHVLGLIDVCFEKDRPCAACQAGKQVGTNHPGKNVMTTSRPLELLHMDLFGPVAYLSIGGNKYGHVIVDDFSRFTWVFFLQDKS
jgi:hypothetical protein